MKKTLLFLSAALLLAALTGCETPPPTTTAPSTVPPTTTVPQTTPPSETTAPIEPITTSPIATTAPTTPTNPSYRIPAVNAPAVLPEAPTLEQLVFSHYQYSASWDSTWSHYDVSVSLPGILPINDGAQVINAQIQETFSPILEELFHARANKGTTFISSIRYEAWMSGNILTVLITRYSHAQSKVYYAYSLDMATGQALTNADLSGLSYPELLYRSCYALKAVNKNHSDSCVLSSVELYTDQNGQLRLCHQCWYDVVSEANIPFDFDAQGPEPISGESGAYHWFFTLETSGSFTTLWEAQLMDLFCHDAPKYIQYLCAEDAEVISDIAFHMAADLTLEELESYRSICQSIRDNAASTDIAGTAQALLDQLVMFEDRSGWYRYSSEFKLVTDNASADNNGGRLYALCFEDIEKFMHYMSLMDPGYYNDYQWAVTPLASPEEIEQLKAVCLAISQDPDASFNERCAAEWMIWRCVSGEEERELMKKALEGREEVTGWKAEVGFIEVSKTTGYAPQYYPTSALYTTHEGFTAMINGDQSAGHYDSTVTNALCQRSVAEIEAQYDEAFFEENFLLRMELRASSETVPTVTGITTGEPSYWMDRLSVCLEYEKGNSPGTLIYVVYIAVPKEYFVQPIGINGLGTPFSFVINGVPFQLYG